MKSDTNIVEQTRAIAAEMAASIRWVVGPKGYDPKGVEYDNGPGTNAHMFWKCACVAQLRLTGIDPNDSLARLDFWSDAEKSYVRIPLEVTTGKSMSDVTMRCDCCKQTIRVVVTNSKDSVACPNCSARWRLLFGSWVPVKNDVLNTATK